MGSGFENGNTDLDSMPAAAHKDQNENSQSHKSICAPGQVIVCLCVSSIVVCSVVESVETSSPEEKLDQNNAQPNNKTSNESDYEKIKVTKDKSTDRGD